MKNFKFIDLFSGIGGFHQAMTELGGECVLASEINKYSIETYFENYGIDSNIDITKLKENDIPYHDVLCAGFPCQAFSKAGAQNGFEDTRGTLFFEIERILKHSRPKFIMLENVRNLVSHDHGKTCTGRGQWRGCRGRQQYRADRRHRVRGPLRQFCAILLQGRTDPGFRRHLEPAASARSSSCPGAGPDRW